MGLLVRRLYGHLPGRDKWLGLAVRLEGGQMFSLTLRDVLRQHHGVQLGNYSYGALAQPGMADRDTQIGPYVSVGPGVRRFGAAHPLTDLSLHPFWFNPSLGMVPAERDVERVACHIEADAWIGAGSIILPGCRRVGVGAVVGAGSVVTRDVADFAVVVGNPARQISTRLSSEARERLLATKYWENSPTDARRVLEDLGGDLDG